MRAWHVPVAPGASEATHGSGRVTRPGSSTTTSTAVWPPVLRTVNEYMMASPGVGVPEPSSSTIAPCVFVSASELTSGGSLEADRLSVASSVSVTVRSPAT